MNQITSLSNLCKFVKYSDSIALTYGRGGKSGQCRAPCHLTDGMTP